MNRIFLLLWLANALLFGDKPLLGLLNGVESNRYMTFKLAKYDLRCEPHGVITLEELAQKGSSSCRAAIGAFYAKSPNLRQFARSHFKARQLYRIEPKAKGCIVYGRGSRSYAQMLLAQGLAVIEPLHHDEEWQYRLKRAQSYARQHALGAWHEEIRVRCIGTMYEVEEE